ncbi:class I SAM-dependent methyltransferase [Candidatus Omnitrophota bacterium]
MQGLDYRNKREQEHFNNLVLHHGETWWGNTTPAGIRRLQRKAKLFTQELRQFQEAAVLEVGCGVGTFTKFILDETPALKLMGCDLSPEAICKTRECFQEFKNLHLGVADVSHLPYRDSTFDAIIGNSILHHLPLKVSLQECFRVLKNQGIVLFSEPNMMNPQIAIEKNIHIIGKLLQNTKYETAFFRWPLTKTLKEIGFRDIVVQPFDFLHPLIPSFLIDVFDYLGRLIERTPIVKEISGSLLIKAVKS